MDSRELVPATKWIARVRDALRRGEFPPFRVNHKFDIPYLGGYSVDGRTIYLDRRLPDMFRMGTHHANLGEFVTVHERVEKWFLDTYHSAYLRAHRIATAMEHQAVREAGLDPVKYEAALRPYIRRCDDETVKRVPVDLDLTPYEDEDDRRILSELMRAEGER